MDWQNQKAQSNQEQPETVVASENYYRLLGLHPSASVHQIRAAYRELSKRFHPDTTDLTTDEATVKFYHLNQAYGVLSNPERRLLYDQSIGYSRIAVIQPPPDLNGTWGKTKGYQTSSLYLDPTDRPLSAGEVFALFILGLTVVGCLVLAIAIGFTKGIAIIYPSPSDSPAITSPMFFHQEIELGETTIQLTFKSFKSQ
ncbi:MAG: J domain-containing protein [Synechococcales cyanobacterium]